MGATSGENDVELNGETDDEDMEDGETGFDDGSAQVGNIPDPGEPTVKEHQEHMTTHRPYRSWCKFCVMGRGVNAPRRRSDAQDDLEVVPHMSMEYGFFEERESEEQVSHVLVIRERRHKMTWAMLVPREGTEFSWITRRAAKFIDQLGHDKVTLRCDNEPRLRHSARKIAQARQEGSQTVPERPPVRKPVQWDHRACGGARGRPGQNTECCAETSCGEKSPARRKDTVLAGGICGIPTAQV